MTVNTANQIRIMKNQVLIMHSLGMILPAVVERLHFSTPGMESIDPIDNMIDLFNIHIKETNNFIEPPKK